MPLRAKAALLALALLPPGALGAGWLFFRLAEGAPVRIESRESRTTDDKPVFNRIRFERRGKLDLWLMQQSHHGPLPAPALWDRLALVVDRESRRVRFLQLPPGPLSLREGERGLPYKVACFLCHANGPRAIRPNPASLAAPLSWRERARVLAWNLRIKTYGRLEAEGGPGLRIAGTFANEALPLRTCLLCHNDHKWGRGRLLRQHFMPMRFLVREREMPPPGIPLLPAEKNALADFLRGVE